MIYIKTGGTMIALHRPTEWLSFEKISQWLQKDGLNHNIEVLIIPVQEKALSTRVIKARVHHIKHDARCRMCKDVLM